MISWAELQLAVMRVLWERGEATVHDVIAALPDERPPAYTTVLTVITNLTKQGLVAHEPRPGSRMFVYRPLVSRQEVQEGISDELIDRLFAGSPAQLVKLLMQTYTFEEQELREIARLACSPPVEEFDLALS